MKTLKKLLYFLTPREQKSAVLLLFLIISMAFIDMIGVASILPFMVVITDPNIIETNRILKYLFQISGSIGVETNNEFIFFLGSLLFLFLILSLSFKGVTTYAQTRFIEMRSYSISKKILEAYLSQSYSWFLNQNSAQLSKTILSETALITGQGLTPVFSLITHIIITIFLFILLLFVDFKLTLIILLVIGGLYFIIFNLFKKSLDRIGKERLITNGMRFKSISEAFGGLKEIKLGGLEKIYINRFSKPSFTFASNQAKSGVIGLLPRYFVEAFSFGGLLLIILYTISNTGNFASSLPTISIYAFAGYRLMPSLQQIYQATTSIKFSSSSINKTYDDIRMLELDNSIENENTLPFNKTITLNQISYNYPNSKLTILKDISLTIPAKKKVGFVGSTGSGKTTIIDIILGLLEPKKGTLEVDGEVINNNNKKSWQRSIGYVPQQIYLSDDTVARNIAFGVNSENINQDMIEKVSKIANLHEFVIGELPNKYNTIIGERGIRLSGGQRQRIGIARALYHNPKVLILDEATSALDNETEKQVIDAINNLDKDITIIIIAHRLNTIKNCDIVFKLQNGNYKIVH